MFILDVSDRMLVASHQKPAPSIIRVLMTITNLKQQSKAKAMKYCAYQERTQQEVRDKLYGYGLYPDAVEELLTDLITEGFIDEERYAQSFARGKFSQNKWGRVKIRLSLQQKRISNYCIEKGLQEIDEKDYYATLYQLIKRKWALLKDDDPYTRKNKTVRYVVGKGYEAELAWKVVEELEIAS